MKRRGAARVVGIDFDDRYLAQARFAAEVTGQEIEFRQLSVYDVARARRALRHRALHGRALPPAPSAAGARPDPRARRARPAGLPVACSAARRRSSRSRADYDFFEQAHFDRPGYPKLHFIEHRYANDPTNWWAPNAAAAEAMLRSAGFEILAHPEEEVYVCRRVERPAGAGAVYPARGGRGGMIEAVKIWNEPNNKSHWDPALDPEWDRFAEMATARRAGDPRRERRRCRGCSGACRRSIRPSSRGWPARARSTHVDVGGGARLSARLEPLADRRVAGEDRRDRGGHRQAGLGDRGRRLVVRLGGGAGLGRAEDRRAAGRAGAARCTGTASTTCRRPGRRRRGTRRRRARPTTGTSTWGCCARTARRSRRSRPTPTMQPTWGSASGSTIEDHRLDEAVAWMRRLGVRHVRTGLSWADSFRDGRARLVRPADGGAGRLRGDGRPSASRPSTAASSRTTPARRRSPRSSPSSARRWSAATRRARRAGPGRRRARLAPWRSAQRLARIARRTAVTVGPRAAAAAWNLKAAERFGDRQARETGLRTRAEQVRAAAHSSRSTGRAARPVRQRSRAADTVDPRSSRSGRRIALARPRAFRSDGMGLPLLLPRRPGLPADPRGTGARHTRRLPGDDPNGSDMTADGDIAIFSTTTRSASAATVRVTLHQSPRSRRCAACTCRAWASTAGADRLPGVR